MAGESSYRGRRRHSTEPPPRAAVRRRASVAAVAVGVVLVGTSVVVGLVNRDRSSLPSPPPTPPEQAVASPDGPLGRQGARPSASPTATPSPTVPAVLALAFEAEAASPGSHGQVVELSGASQGQAVRLSGAAEGTFVEFSGVEVAAAGGYDLTIFYLSEKDRDGGVSVNGGSPVRFTFAGQGENGAIGSVSVRVDLAAGANTILIGTPGGAPVSLDLLTVTG